MTNPNLPPHGPAGKDNMHPQDMRNMFIFFVLAALLYFSFDALVLDPQREAMQERAKVEAELAQTQGPQITADGSMNITKPRSEVLTSTPGGRITFENTELKGSIDLNGGSINDAELLDYFKTLESKENVSTLNPRGAAFPRSIEYGWISSDPNIAVPNKDSQWQVSGNTTLTPDTPVTLVWDNGAGLIFERVISLDEHFMFTITQSVRNISGVSVTLYPYGLISQKGVPYGYQPTWISHEGPVGFIGEELFEESYKTLRKDQKMVENADIGWFGFGEKYWLTALIPPQNQNVKYSFSYAGDKKDKNNEGLYQADFLAAAKTVAPGQIASSESRLYVGAKRVLLLQEYQKDQRIPKFDLAVDFGWFWFMTKPFFYIMHYLNLWIGNMGIAIIVMTIMIRGAVFPLTNTSYRSFAKMKKVAPIVSAMREKYGDDKQAMQQELMKMYQREGVNPMSGCLPILVQIPIFFALYKTFFVSIELRHEPFFGWIQDLSAADPTSVFNLFGLIPWDPPAILMIGVWPCLMLLVMVVQRKLNPPPTDPIQRDIAMYMPFLFAFIMSRFAAGLVVYWTFSALIGVIQQAIIMKSMGVPIHLFGEEADEDEVIEVKVDEDAPLLEENTPNDEPPKPIKPPKPKKSKKKK